MMLFRAPLRVSLFGGGTDYPAYYSRKPGAVIGFAIDKYIYTSVLPLTSFVEYRFRLAYSKIETVDKPAKIQHPVVRAALYMLDCGDPMDISVQADLPASSGLGSSSSFAVCVLTALHGVLGHDVTKGELAQEAIRLERDLLKEHVGDQDQYHASFGGFHRFDFIPIPSPHVGMTDLSEHGSVTEHMLLVHTGIKRWASDIAREQVRRTARGMLDQELDLMVNLTNEAEIALRDADEERRLHQIARLLRESWEIKRSLSPAISSPQIDDLYELCLRHGALAGKLCGAGGGGFFLVVVPSERRKAFIDAVGERRCVSFGIDHQGAKVLRTNDDS